MSTAFFHRQSYVQRLRGKGHAPLSSGSRRRDPGALRLQRRPERHNSLSGKHQKPCDLGLCKCVPEAKTAALPTKASSLTILLLKTTTRMCRLGAMAGHTPPFPFNQPRGPPDGSPIAVSTKAGRPTPAPFPLPHPARWTMPHPFQAAPTGRHQRDGFHPTLFQNRSIVQPGGVAPVLKRCRVCLGPPHFNPRGRPGRPSGFAAGPASIFEG
jgi:hypothetical protein